jgi:hypothetical protein
MGAASIMHGWRACLISVTSVGRARSGLESRPPQRRQSGRP